MDPTVFVIELAVKNLIVRREYGNVNMAFTTKDDCIYYVQINRLTTHNKLVIQVAVKSNFLWKMSKNHKTCHQLISRQLICQISNKVTISDFIKITNNYMYEEQSQTLYYYWSKLQ